MGRSSGGRSSKSSESSARSSKANRSSSGSHSSGGLGNKRSSGGFSGGGRSSGGFSAGGRTSGRSTASSSPKPSTGTSSNKHPEPERKPDSAFEHKVVYTPPYDDYDESSFDEGIENHGTYHAPPPRPPKAKVRRKPKPSKPRRQRKFRFKILLKGFGYFFIFYVLISTIMSFLGYSPASTDENIPDNTTKREPLQGIVIETEWYEDELGWIHDSNLLIKGLNYFYSETGVQPYIILIKGTDEFWQDSFDEAAADQYLEELYREKFSDEGHFVFAYFSSLDDSKEEMNGEFRYLSGLEADKIMDEEALTIFWANFEKNYYDTSLSIEEMIADTFETTGRSIMNMPITGKDIIIVMVVIGIAYFMIRFFYKKIKNKNQKKEDTKIFAQPLKTFGTDTSELEEKYK